MVFSQLLKSVFLMAVVLLFMTTAVIAQSIGSLNIVVTDQNGAFIPTINIRLKTKSQIIKEVKNPNSETINFSKLLGGIYSLEIEANGFKPHSQEIEIKEGKNEITIKLEIAQIVENLDVKQDAQDKSVDPREGAFTNFLTKQQLENLPESPEELEKALKEQFGQDAIISVDGFSGGRLPNKSEIASIRVTRSSFDAEYHQLGATMIDIVTKAGNGRWSGSFSFKFNDDLLNARNPFSIKRLKTQQKIFDLFLNGPIIKNKTTFSITTFGNYSYRESSILAALPNLKVNDSVRNSSNFFYPNVKISHNLNKTNTINLSYNGTINQSKNLGVGGFNLPERGYDSKMMNHQFRLSESFYLGEKFLNEFRFQYTNETAKTNPVSDKTAIIVLDAFSDGGAGNKNNNQKQGIWISNNLLFGVGNINAIKIGGLFEFERLKNESAINQNGTFTFSSLADYVLGRPNIFTQRLGIRNIKLSQTQVGVFFQDDIRLSKSFLLSLGLRYEWQNNLKDYNNFSPRLGFTWSPFKSGKLNFRGGIGFYYNWLETNNLSTVLSQSLSQTPKP